VDREVIGMVEDSAFGSVRLAPQPIGYGVIREASLFELYVRSPLDLGSVVKKLLAGIGGVFAFLGLLLAAIGLFGLLNYSVTRRTKEIGIRAALGARAPSLVFLVLKDLLALIAGGLAAGFACSLALMTFVRSLLFGIRPVDPLVMITAAAVFLLAAFISGGLPASRAAAIDPMLALRHE
jgi:ABC-type antimicrobial peptide transport system permease subunit